MSNYDESNSIGAVAIVGMAGRFPGAKDMESFWSNLYSGVESVKFFEREELIKMGINENLLDNPRFTPADAILDGMEEFDASFFGYSAREAEIMDPQHRLFLESAWEVLESAGYNSELYDGRIAVFASANLSGYMLHNLYSNPDLVEKLGSFKIMLANGQDFLATKVSYNMNLMGPSINVNTLCSSSSVAVHYACQNLLNYGCDIALAGGVSFQVSRNDAFFYQEGGIGSSDGHCHAFDSKASGTVSGSGLAVIALKRLEDAIADGDYIHAVIRGTGINNDGSAKNSYTAPNVDGQAECIAEAIAVSGVDPETITYIEAHGTGTDLGDPIEIAALTKAFRAYTAKKQFCGIGSVKTNIGHLVNAGGLASIVKTVLSMQHKVLPPSLNFNEPNPKIDFMNSPFYVNTKAARWETNGFPLRAGVSSFGIGGTNTHIILEEAPEIESSMASRRPFQLITLSAKTGTALEKMTGNLKEFLKKNPKINIADVAYTLQMGRKNFNYKRFFVCENTCDLLEKIENMNEKYVFSKYQKPKDQPVVFMFSDEGEYINLGLKLYKTENEFRSTIDKCAGILQTLIGMDIRKVLYPEEETKAWAKVQLLSRSIGKGILFAVEYALAKLWISWGVEPQYMLGEATGEYVAACIAGVINIEDALKLVITNDEYLSDIVSNMNFSKANIPFISSITGSWILDPEAQSPHYWIKQRTAQNLSKGLQEVLKDSDQIIIEIGPGNKLTAEANEYKLKDSVQTILSCIGSNSEENGASQAILVCVGEFWLAGGKIDWRKYYSGEKRHRIPLPTYPFERQRYWIEPGKFNKAEPNLYIGKKEDLNKDYTASQLKEGIITLTVNLDESDKQQKQLDEIFAFKEQLELLSKQFPSICPNLQISQLGLKLESQTGQAAMINNDKLQMRPRPELGTAYLAPKNEVERAIVDKWQEILGFDKIGVNDDFFELGGHSLIAAAIANDLSKRFEVQIPMRILFETTTVAEIAKLIETYKWAAVGNSAKVENEEFVGGTI